MSETADVTGEPATAMFAKRHAAALTCFSWK